MKNQCLLLVKNRLDAQLGFGVIKYGRDKKLRRNRLSLTVVLGFVFLMLSVYCGVYAWGLCRLGLGPLVPVYAFFICSVVSLLLTVFKTPGELFGYGDFDFLMSLPVKTSTVIASRFINLYLWSTFLSLLVMLPMGAVYAVFTGPGPLFYPMWLAGILVACFIPTTIAVVVGALVAAIASKFRRSGVAGAVLMIVFVCAMVAAPMGLTGGQFVGADGSLNMARLQTGLSGLSGMLYRIYPPAKLFAKGVTEGNIPAFLLLIAISVGWYLLFIRALSPFYKKINTAVSTYRVSSDYEVRGLNQGSALSALYKKELRRWAGSSIYLSNTVIGAVMALLVSGALLIVGVDKIAQSLQMPLAGETLAKFAAYVTAACLAMACTTAASVSLEGKSVWILQSLPVPMKTVVDSKLLMNLTLTIPGALFSSALLVIALRPGFAGGFIDFLVPLAFSVFSPVWGLWINLKMPNYDWESDTQAVKQSMPSAIGILSGMLLALVFAVLASVSPLDYRLFGLIAGGVLLAASWVLYASMLKKYTKLPVK